MDSIAYNSTALGVPPDKGPSITPLIINGFSREVPTVYVNGELPVDGEMIIEPSDPPKQDTSSIVVVKLGVGSTVKESVEEFVPHALEPTTLTFPELEPKSTVMLLVPAPDVIEAPDGTDQLYESKLVGRTYVTPVSFGHTALGPDIDPIDGEKSVPETLRLKEP